jgi:hypothetical protein
MKVRSILMATGAAGLLFSAAYAQNKQSKQKAEKPVVPKKTVFEMALGRNGTDVPVGDITEGMFDSIAPSGIRIKDPKGAFIEGFSFTYGERNIYEDSAGTERIVTDYLTEYCLGDTLSAFIAQNIAKRTKPGDTAYYDQINIRMPDGKAALGKPMKFVIVR